MRARLETAIGVVALVLTGCGQSLPRCIEGSAPVCACPDGRTGSQVCTAAGRLGACVCTGPFPGEDAGPRDAGPADLGVDATPDADSDSGMGPDAALDAGDGDLGTDASADLGTDSGDASDDLGADAGLDAALDADLFVRLDGGGIVDGGVPGVEVIAPSGGTATALSVDDDWVAWVWTTGPYSFLDVVHTDGTALTRVAAAVAPATLGPVSIGPCPTALTGVMCGTDVLFWTRTEDVAGDLWEIEAVELPTGVFHHPPPVYSAVSDVDIDWMGSNLSVANTLIDGRGQIATTSFGAYAGSMTRATALGIDHVEDGAFTAERPSASGSGDDCVVSYFPPATTQATVPCVPHAGWRAPGLATPSASGSRRYFTYWSSSVDLHVASVSRTFSGSGETPMEHVVETGAATAFLAHNATDVFWLRASGRIGRLGPSLVVDELPDLGASPTLFGASTTHFFWPDATGLRRMALP